MASLTYVANTSHMFLMLAADEQSKSQSPSAPKPSNGRFKSHAFVSATTQQICSLISFLINTPMLSTGTDRYVDHRDRRS